MATPSKKINKSITFTQEASDQTLMEAIEQGLAEQQYGSFSELCKQALQQLLLTPQPQSSDHESTRAVEQHLGELQVRFDQLLDDVEELLAAKDKDSSNQLEEQVKQVSHQLKRVDHKVEHQLGVLQEHFDRLESILAVTADEQPDSANLSHLQLDRLAQQVEGMSLQVTQQLAVLQDKVTNVETSFTVPESNPLEGYFSCVMQRIEQIEAQVSHQLIEMQQKFDRLEQVFLTPSSGAANFVEEQSVKARVQQPSVPDKPSQAVEPLKPASANAARHSDPVLSRLSSLLEDF